MNYSVLEEAVRSQFVTHFGADLPDACCVSGDIDKLFMALQEGDQALGVLLEFGKGAKMKQAPFNGKVWVWVINGILILRYQGDNSNIEQDVRQRIDQVANVFDGHATLGGLTPLVAVTDIDTPEPALVNEVPFYWLPFTIEVLDKV